MTRCPIHNRPLVRTFRGSIICIACYLAKCQEDRKAVIKYTDTKLNDGNKERGNRTRRANGVPVGKGRRRPTTEKPGRKAAK